MDIYILIITIAEIDQNKNNLILFWPSLKNHFIKKMSTRFFSWKKFLKQERDFFVRYKKRIRLLSYHIDVATHLWSCFTPINTYVSVGGKNLSRVIVFQGNDGYLEHLTSLLIWELDKLAPLTYIIEYGTSFLW